jgi:phage terminase large subunit-like protein
VSDRDPIAMLAGRTPAEQAWVLSCLSGPQRRELDQRWWAWAHAGQLSPDGDWLVWLICAGRGFGKTRAGAEWISAMARERPNGRFALVGGTADDVRRVMIDGESGLLAVARDREKIVWRQHLGTIEFASGAQARVFSAGAPEALRGPQHDIAWCDELGKWGRSGAAAWDNLMLTLRGGTAPRVLVTTTPRANPLMLRVERIADHVMRGATRDNLSLPPSFVAAMVAQYGGTRLGRQELDGELIVDVDGALWTRATIERCRVRAADMPAVTRVVIGVDPPAGIGGDACGIVAVALGEDRKGYVLEDASVVGASPDGWARAVAACAARHAADKVVAEANQGGEMVRSVLRAADETLQITLVHAAHGKVARAEPVAALYERGKVRHVGGFPALEDELCGLVTGGGYEGPGRSPDRADALVWALHALLLKQRGAAAVRVV